MSSSIGNIRWRIVCLLALSYAVLYITRSTMSIAGPVLMKDFGWSATEFGWVSTSFFIGYAVMMLPSGSLSDRFGGGRILILGTLFWSLLTFLTPFAGTIIIMMILRALVGMGQSVAMPGISALVAQWITKKESGVAQGFCLMGIPIATAFTMGASVGIMQLWGWQSIFYLYAFLGPIWVVAWLMFGKDKPEDHAKITPAEVAYIRAGQGASDIPGQAEEEITSKDIFASRSVWCAAISYFCSNYLFFLFLTWLPVYFSVGRGFSLSDSGIYTMFPYLAAVITYPLGGYLTDRAAEKFGQNIGRKLLPIVGLIAAGSLLIMGSSAENIGTAIAYISASNGFLCLTMGGFFSIPIVFSRKNAGKIVGFNGIWGTSAGVLAPIVTGLIIDMTGVYTYGLYLGAGVALVGAVVMLFGCQVKPLTAKH